MDVSFILDCILHMDKHLNTLLENYNTEAYIILFLVLFLETGVVITPFLPGDSILFAIGAIAGVSGLINVPVMLFLLCTAAILGDSLNYEIGKLMRNKLKKKQRLPLIKMEHIQKTQAFFDRHGGKTITIARFIPIIRTFAPFISGAAKMEYHKFLFYNIIGGISWVLLMFGLGYFIGNIGYVQENFFLIMIAIIVVSIIPGIISFIKNKQNAAKEGEGQTLG